MQHILVSLTHFQHHDVLRVKCNLLSAWQSRLQSSLWIYQLDVLKFAVMSCWDDDIAAPWQHLSIVPAWHFYQGRPLEHCLEITTKDQGETTNSQAKDPLTAQTTFIWTVYKMCSINKTCQTLFYFKTLEETPKILLDGLCPWTPQLEKPCHIFWTNWHYMGHNFGWDKIRKYFQLLHRTVLEITVAILFPFPPSASG